MSQEAFAQKLGVKQPTVCDWVNGRVMPRTKWLIEISRETGIRADKLLASVKRD